MLEGIGAGQAGICCDHGSIDGDDQQAFSVVPLMLHGDAAFADVGVWSPRR